MKLEELTSGSELTAEAVAVLESGHTTIPPTFVRDLYGRVPPEDLVPYSPQTLAALAAEAYEHLKAPRAGQGEDIRLHDNAVMFLRNMAAFSCILLKKDVQIG